MPQLRAIYHKFPAFHSPMFCRKPHYIASHCMILVTAATCARQLAAQISLSSLWARCRCFGGVCCCLASLGLDLSTPLARPASVSPHQLDPQPTQARTCIVLCDRRCGSLPRMLARIAGVWHTRARQATSCTVFPFPRGTASFGTGGKGSCISPCVSDGRRPLF